MIILLDIDGVCNSFNNTPDDILAIDHPYSPGTFCKKNLDALKGFIDSLYEPYAIHINSTWMYYHSDEVIRDAFARNGFDGNKIFFGAKIPPKNASQLARMKQNQAYAKVWTINSLIEARPGSQERIISIDDLRLQRAHRHYFKETLDRVEFYQTNPRIGFDESIADLITANIYHKWS